MQKHGRRQPKPSEPHTTPPLSAAFIAVVLLWAAGLVWFLFLTGG